jgi:hypothetical protein
MITLDEYLNHWKIEYGDVSVSSIELTDGMRTDAKTTIDRANALLASFGHDRGIASGWRPFEVNRLVSGAATHSNHTLCRAIDIVDGDGSLDEWAIDNVESLIKIGLWQEMPSSTPGWAHFQIVPPHSGNRVFIP